MRWFKKEIENRVSNYQGDFISPVELHIRFDSKICYQKIDTLLTYGVNLTVDVDQLIELLNEKHLLFSQLLQEDSIDELQYTHLEKLVNSNQSLNTYLESIPLSVLRSQIKMLLHGEDELNQRMNLFMTYFGDVPSSKLENTIWNFMAELLHFFRPETYPLMSRWVWHEQVQKGVMKEFVLGKNGPCKELMGGQSVDFEAYRVWFAQQLGKKGFFQDIHYFIDLIYAQAYADYIMSITSQVNTRDRSTADSHIALGIISKLLGIKFNQNSPLSIPRNVTIH